MHRIDENTDYHDIGARAGFINKLHMTFVQVAHGRHQRDAFPILTPAADLLTQQRQGFDNYHSITPNADTLVERVLFSGVNALLYVLNILLHRRADIAALCQEVFSEFWRVATGNAEGVVHHQDLSIGGVTGTNADHRNGQGFGDLACQFGWYALQHQ
ncbi:hypothetical protein D3C73_1258300 [compost metagenome]